MIWKCKFDIRMPSKFFHHSVAYSMTRSSPARLGDWWCDLRGPPFKLVDHRGICEHLIQHSINTTNYRPRLYTVNRLHARHESMSIKSTQFSIASATSFECLKWSSGRPLRGLPEDHFEVSMPAAISFRGLPKPNPFLLSCALQMICLRVECTSTRSTLRSTLAGPGGAC